MHSRLQVATQGALVRIFQGPQLLDKSEIEIIDKRDPVSSSDESELDDLLLSPLVRRIDPPLPWFRKLPNGQFVTPQERVFGYYALRNILRGLFLGGSFLPPGDTLLKNGFLSSSVATYYGASFHLMLAYLSLEGRVAITPVYGPPYIELSEAGGGSGHKPIPGNPRAICAILTADGQWIFEGRTRTHRAYWAELDRVLLQTKLVPECFIEFAHYLTSYGPYKDEHSNDLEMVRNALPYLQDARHEALYQGYGYDPWSDDLLTNRDAGRAPIDLRAKKYQAFSYGLLNHIVSETDNLVTHLNDHCQAALNRAKLGLTLSIVTPPFELRRDIADLLTDNMCSRHGFSRLMKQFLLEQM